MIIAPSLEQAQTTYHDGAQQALAALSLRSSLPHLPWALLALSATYYLGDYVPSRQHKTEMDAARERAIAEAQRWQSQPLIDSLIMRDLDRVIALQPSRSELYRWTFDQAITANDPWRLVLAQHACELADVLPDDQLARSLRLGVLPLDIDPAIGESSVTLNSPSDLLERSSRALLGRTLPADRFADAVLWIHAARRARELAGADVVAPLDHVMSWIGAVPEPRRGPRSVPFVHPASLTVQALTVQHPRAILLVEAGLVEAESLNGAQQVLLWAALARALATYC